MLRKNLMKIEIALLCLVAFIPFLLWIFVINNYGVNIPYQDQWSNPLPQIEAYFNGNLSLQLLFKQYNEIRPATPRFLSLVLAMIGKQWNTRWEMFLGLILCGLISLLVLLLLFRTNPKRPIQNLFVIILFNYLLLSPASWYFHLFSITFERLIVDFCFFMNLVVYTLFLIPSAKVAIFIIGSIIAQYSHSGGILIWVLSLPLIINLGISNKQKIRSVFIYFLFFIGSCWFYFWNYKSPPQHPSMTSIFNYSVIDCTRFFLAFLGNPFSTRTDITLIEIEAQTDTYNLSTVVGFIILLTFSSIIFFVISDWLLDKRIDLYKIIPWVLLGCYPICLAILATINRLPISISMALRGDYIIQPIYLTISTIILLFILKNQFPINWLRQAPYFLLGLMFGLLVSHNLGTNHLLNAINFHDKLNYQKSCLQLSNFYHSEKCIKSVEYIWDIQSIQKMNSLSKLNAIQPGIANSLDVDRSFTGEPGKIELLVKDSEGIHINGWAMLDKEPAHAVVVTYEPQGKQPQIIDIFAVGQFQDEIKRSSFRKIIFSRAHWKGTIKIEKFPSDINVCFIQAYSFDSQNNSLVKLNKSSQLVKECK
jgi:hypothetical protein